MSEDESKKNFIPGQVEEGKDKRYVPRPCLAWPRKSWDAFISGTRSDWLEWTPVSFKRTHSTADSLMRVGDRLPSKSLSWFSPCSALQQTLL